MEQKRIAPMLLISSLLLLHEGSDHVKGNNPDTTKIKADIRGEIEQVLPSGNLEQTASNPEHPGICIRQDYQNEVGGIPLSPEEEQYYHADIVRQLLEENIVLDADQYLLYVDRNPDVQRGMIVLVEATSYRMATIGADKVSTGKKGRVGYFLTPTGVFRHTPDNVGYRAEGTKNSQGIRALGKKGMRIWDLGWTTSHTGWLKRPEERDMRLQIHATDPDLLEQRLGQPASKGCIRVSTKMNNFLDLHSILDRSFESKMGDRKVSWLFRKDRITSPFEGEYVIVGDSSNAPIFSLARAQIE